MKKTIECPYCGEESTVSFDPAELGHLVVDCPVCAGPWTVIATQEDGELVIDVREFESRRDRGDA